MTIPWREAARAVGNVEESETEHWMVKKITISEDAASWSRLRSVISGGGMGRGSVQPGDIMQLIRKPATLVMSDTPDELNDNWPLFGENPHGRVLVNGLGLGCVIRGLLTFEAVEHIDVVEVDAEVIDLIGRYFKDNPRVTIHHGDAFTYKWPVGTRWDFVWHDVWDNLSTDNLSSEDAVPGSYATLNRRYGRRTGWQGAWGQELLRYEQRRENRNWWGW